MKGSIVEKAFIVSGMPHILLGKDRSAYWRSLYDSYACVRADVEAADADLILYFSTQWLSVIGYLFQADPRPKWTLVDNDWHELGSMPYEFEVDAGFAEVYAQEVKNLGHHTALVNYYGFPIDSGTVVAQKLLNPHNRLPAAMVSCNMYSEKNEMLLVGQAGARALARSGKKAIVVLVSNLSNRFHTVEIDPERDRISSAKDHEWNLKLCELLSEGRMEDVAQVAREVAREANGDMGFRGIWWLNGLLGQTNHFSGHVYDYQPVYGAGAALIQLDPSVPVQPLKHVELESESKVIAAATLHDPKLKALDSQEVTNFEPPSPKPEAAVPKTAPVPRPAPPQRDTRVHTAKAPEPVGPYPHARREGGFLFLSGIGPRKPGTKTIPGVVFDEAGRVIEEDIEAQTRSVIENIETVLIAAGSSLDHVIDVQVFLTHMKRDFAAFNKVYGERLGKIGPTRTTVEVSSLPTPIAVELKVVARLDT